MTAPAGFLDFFVLEASEYIDQLDALMLNAGGSGPDLESLQRAARALRGSATMAKLPAFAEMASGIERVAHGLRGGVTQWDPALAGALVATIDDCKLLLRNVRGWGAADDARSREAPGRSAGALRSRALRCLRRASARRAARCTRRLRGRRSRENPQGPSFRLRSGVQEWAGHEVRPGHERSPSPRAARVRQCRVRRRSRARSRDVRCSAPRSPGSPRRARRSSW